MAHGRGPRAPLPACVIASSHSRPHGAAADGRLRTPDGALDDYVSCRRADPPGCASSAACSGIRGSRQPWEQGRNGSRTPRHRAGHRKGTWARGDRRAGPRSPSASRQARCHGSRVFVLSKDGQPLMPCHPARARELLHPRCAMRRTSGPRE
ncbi:RRXRR domain-containing protein [Streptomyces sp. NPDC050211]|uniref:RRXRR domain-containing protein n=1 Tax=Streptomyces sp. NPDC050211 TaxID=3154932 RepID=UPI003444135A